MEKALLDTLRLGRYEVVLDSIARDANLQNPEIRKEYIERIKKVASKADMTLFRYSQGHGGVITPEDIILDDGFRIDVVSRDTFHVRAEGLAFKIRYLGKDVRVADHDLPIGFHGNPFEVIH